jgi:hypothetical protein
MSYVDIDGNPSTFMSSSDSLNLANCSEVLWAGLYWSARVSTGGTPTTTTNYATRNQIKLKVNNGAYQTLVADDLLDNSTGHQTYHCYKNITSIVQSSGIKARYTVADLVTRTGVSAVYGGWTIVVVYKNVYESMRNLTVFDGLARQDPDFARYLQIGRGLCPMVPGIGDAACQAMTGNALNLLAQPLSPAIVLIAGQWPLYVRAHMPEQEKRQFLKGFESMLYTLSSAGKQIVFVHVVPLGALPRTCIRRMNTSFSDGCDIPLKTALARESGYRTQLDAMLKRFKVIEFDPAEYLCNEKNCRVSFKSEIFYLDDSHLSRSGGNAIALKSHEWFALNLVFGK